MGLALADIIKILDNYDDKEKMDAFLSERQERRTDSQVYGEACIRKGLSQMQHRLLHHAIAPLKYVIFLFLHAAPSEDQCASLLRMALYTVGPDIASVVPEPYFFIAVCLFVYIDPSVACVIPLDPT